MNLIKAKLVSTALGYAGKKMDGKKTIGGAAGKMLIGLSVMGAGAVGILSLVFPDQGLPGMSLEASLASLSLGFYGFCDGLQGIGVAHKFVKAMAAKAQVPVEPESKPETAELQTTPVE
jgi:hypothetical protein